MSDSFPWIVSSSTLKTEHLLVSFWNALESLSSSASFPFELSPSLLSTLERLVGEDSKEEDYKEEEAAEALLSLFDLLQEASPPGFYFGSHPGDGALFGFWLSDDWESALEDCSDFLEEDPSFLSSLIGAAEGYGISAETFSDCFRGEVSGYSEKEAEEEAARNEEEAAWEAGAKDRSMANLRAKRNSLLKETDHYGLSDVTMSDEMSTYRQELRDLPSTVADDDTASDVDAITFPTKP